MYLLQFIAIQKAKLLERLIHKGEKQNSLLVFDLEDTLSNFIESGTENVKDWGRSELVQLSQLWKNLGELKKIGVRVNRFGSMDFYKDVLLLQNLQKNWTIDTIVLPKVSTKKMLIEALYFFNTNNISYGQCIPIVETIEGMENLASIATCPNIKWVIYGHNDYSVALGHWPFLRGDELNFWKIVDPFIHTVEKNGVQYIHPPISSLSNQVLFETIIFHLKKICNLPFGVMAINSSQVSLMSNMHFDSLNEEKCPLYNYSYSLEEKLEKARLVKRLFSQRKRQRFVVDTLGDQFITPHMFEAASLYLKRNDA